MERSKQIRTTRLQIWGAETGKQVGKPLQGHTDWVVSVAFAPVGTRVASGLEDRWMKVANEGNDERNGGKSDRTEDPSVEKESMLR